MRLETESRYSTMVENTGAIEAATENFDQEANDALREGVRAAQAGDRGRARTALLRAAELDPSSESAWLWLASISEYPEELLVFLNNVLDINPYNARANEWMTATKSLLAKTFVQRGVDAANGGQADFAAQCFNQALENDQNNVDAWVWLAKLADSNEGKLSYLEKVLEIDPDNEEAKFEYHTAKNAINQKLLAEARAAAVAGRNADSNDLLDAFLLENPDSEDGWILRSHLAEGFAQKIAAFEKVIEINPGNLTARSGMESLKAIMAMVAPAEAAAAEESPDLMENTAYALEAERTSFADPVHDKSPTQELEFPAAAVEYHQEMTQEAHPVAAFEPVSEAVEEVREEEMPVEAAQEQEAPQAVIEPEPVPEPVAAAEQIQTAEAHESAAEDIHRTDAPEIHETVPSNNDWGMNTIAFSFAFPGGELAAEPAVADETFEAVSMDEEVTSVEPAEYASIASPVEIEEGSYSIPVPSDELALPVRSVADVDPGASFVPSFETVIERPEPAPVSEASHYEVPAYAAEVVSEPVAEPVYVGVADVVVEDSIPMPLDFSVPAALVATGFETKIVRTESEMHPASAAAACPFCMGENPSQAFTCGHCLATLTLSDLEMLLANGHADKATLRESVKAMEAEKESRPLSERELTNLGIAHLNLRDFNTGYKYLHEASQLNPNNVVLAGQVNSLLIRLDEIKRHEEAHEAKPREKKILVVDDSATVRKLIAGKLEKCGHEVYCAADGVEAIEQLDSITPDLILLDITMPRMDGYQVCKVIRGKDTTRDIPVVMISGKDGFFDKVRGRMAGTTGYITKPFGPETLMKAVETYLKGEVIQ